MAEGEEKDDPLRISVSRRLREYLVWLSENTLLGRTDKDVARYLLTKVLEEMRQSDYREKKLPNNDST